MKNVINIMLLSIIFLSLFACENKNGWYGDYYYENNRKVRSEWRQYGSDWYYCGHSGEVVKNSWINNEYYVDEKGKMLKNTFTPDGYFVGADGKYINMSTLKNGILEIPTISQYSSSTIIENIASVKFGSYYQNNNIVKEPIEWIVLEKNENEALLLSKYILDCKCYNETRTNTDWELCTLRNWLNDYFYNLAFDENEKNNIIITNLINNDNINNKNGKIKWSTSGGPNTNDKVFLLSIDECDKYFGKYYIEYGYKPGGENIPLDTKGTPYAKSINNNSKYLWVASEEIDEEGATNNYGPIDIGTSNFWLRSPGKEPNRAATVYAIGDISSSGSFVNSCTIGVRPAIWVKY